jgi:hypothetical protein
MIELEIRQHLTAYQSKRHNESAPKYGSVIEVMFFSKIYICLWPTVEEWANENIRSKLMIIRKVQRLEQLLMNQFYACFEDDRDAILFKMRWL